MPIALEKIRKITSVYPMESLAQVYVIILQKFKRFRLSHHIILKVFFGSKLDGIGKLQFR